MEKKNNMADEESDEEGFNSEAFDVTRDLPVFLASVLDKAEYICENDVDEGTAEAHDEVIDQSIRLLRSISDCYDIGTNEKEELDSLAATFTDVLSSLNLHVAIKPPTPATVAGNCFAPGKEGKETPGRPCFDIPAEMLEELRELGFSWVKIYIGEMLPEPTFSIKYGEHLRFAKTGCNFFNSRERVVRTLDGSV